MKRQDKRFVVVLDMGKQVCDAYPTVTDAAVRLGVERHQLDYGLKQHDVWYVNGCFVSWAEVTPDSRGGNSGINQGFNSKT